MIDENLGEDPRRTARIHLGPSRRSGEGDWTSPELPRAQMVMFDTGPFS